MRHFEQDDRYWDIGVTDTKVQIKWGARGKPQQRLDRAFATTAEAAAYAEKHITAQQAKGYVETSARADVAPLAESRHARFEWGAGEPAFREILLSGLKVNDRAGVIDEHDRDHLRRIDTQHLPTLAAAHAYFDALCIETRGYAEEIDLAARAQERSRAVTVPRAPTPPPPTYSDLETQCLEHPDDAEPWLVYADHLESIGDPRGAIAALARAGKRVDRRIRDQLAGITDDDLAEDEEAEPGSAAAMNWKFELRHGFVHHVEIGATHDANVALDLVTRRFLASPFGRFVDSLRFGLASYEGNNDWAPTLRAVVESPQAPRLRSLAFDAYTCDDQEISWVGYGDFSGLLEQLPALAHLRLRAGQTGTLGRLPRSLQTFVRESGGLARTEIDEVLREEHPHLTHLELWTGSRHYGAECTLDDLQPILDARALPRLTHLGIVNSELVDELVPALARSRILAQLTSLDLSRGIAAEAATAAFVAHAAAFRHLASIDLSANVLDAAQVARIRAVLDNVIVTDQRTCHGDERYVSVGE